jgi:hypothetical protein
MLSFDVTGWRLWHPNDQRPVHIIIDARAPMSPLLSDDQRAELVRLGPEHVRLRVAAAFGGRIRSESFISGFACDSIRLDAIDDWLANAYREERRKRRLNEVSDSEQARTGRSANKAAWIAATASIVAIVEIIWPLIFPNSR